MLGPGRKPVGTGPVEHTVYRLDKLLEHAKGAVRGLADSIVLGSPNATPTSGCACMFT